MDGSEVLDDHFRGAARCTLSASPESFFHQALLYRDGIGLFRHQTS
jgi:hypothetical protein